LARRALCVEEALKEENWIGSRGGLGYEGEEREGKGKGDEANGNAVLIAGCRLDWRPSELRIEC
jgi:hypothetical protein